MTSLLARNRMGEDMLTLSSVHGSKVGDVFKPAVYWLDPLTELIGLGVDSRNASYDTRFEP